MYWLGLSYLGILELLDKSLLRLEIAFLQSSVFGTLFVTPVILVPYIEITANHLDNRKTNLIT